MEQVDDWPLVTAEYSQQQVLRPHAATGQAGSLFANTFRSISLNAIGGTPVGMMAWWSVTFDVSNTFLDLGNDFPPKALTICAYGCVFPKVVLYNPFMMEGHLG